MPNPNRNPNPNPNPNSNSTPNPNSNPNPKPDPNPNPNPNPGSGYNRPFSIELRGRGLTGLGDQKCVLGPSVTPPWTTRSYDSVRAKAYNSSYAVCDFDPIPDVDRDQARK